MVGVDGILRHTRSRPAADTGSVVELLQPGGLALVEFYEDLGWCYESLLLHDYCHKHGPLLWRRVCCDKWTMEACLVGNWSK